MESRVTLLDAVLGNPLSQRWHIVEGTHRQFQVVIPIVLTDDMLSEDILNDLHAGAVGGHMGEEKIIFYWPGFAALAQEWHVPNVPPERQVIQGELEN